MRRTDRQDEAKSLFAILRTRLAINTYPMLGFTLSQATKALRESRVIALLYFRPLHYKWVRGQRHAPAAPCPRERPGTHCTGGWVGLRAGLEWRWKSRPTGIRSPDRPARRQSLYRLRYPAHHILCYRSKLQLLSTGRREERIWRCLTYHIRSCTFYPLNGPLKGKPTNVNITASELVTLYVRSGNDTKEFWLFTLKYRPFRSLNNTV